MKAFETYLLAQNNEQTTIKNHINNLLLFARWVSPETNEIPMQITVMDTVDYINHLRKRQLNPATINNYLRSINIYCKYLESEGNEVANIDNVRVKDVRKKVVVDPLDYSDLEGLYKAYSTYKKQQVEKLKESRLIRASKTCLNVGKKRKLMLSFMVFQGIHSGELKKIEINHINQEEGTIYISGTKKSQSRTLKLAPFQFAALFGYLQELRQEQIYLFEGNLNNQINDMMQELRGLNQKVQNAIHLRASVIMHWLKLHGKRKTQYMIGHKWISSTEHYELQDLETLNDQLKLYHPLN